MRVHGGAATSAPAGGAAPRCGSTSRTQARQEARVEEQRHRRCRDRVRRDEPQRAAPLAGQGLESGEERDHDRDVVERARVRGLRGDQEERHGRGVARAVQVAEAAQQVHAEQRFHRLAEQGREERQAEARGRHGKHEQQRLRHDRPRHRRSQTARQREAEQKRHPRGSPPPRS
jgi:hypothetical protein